MKETICQECLDNGVLNYSTEPCSEECWDAAPSDVHRVWERRHKKEEALYSRWLHEGY
jgi:hypothetical protein